MSSGGGPGSLSPSRGVGIPWKDLQQLRADGGRNRVVPGIQRRPEGGETGDGDYSDEGRDESVLDRGRTSLIAKELRQEGAHC